MQFSGRMAEELKAKGIVKRSLLVSVSVVGLAAEPPVDVDVQSMDVKEEPKPAADEPKPAPPRQSSDGKVLVGLDFQDLPDGSVQLALGLGFPDGQDITMQRVVRAQ